MKKFKSFVFILVLFGCQALLGFEIDATHTQGNGVGYKRQYSKIGLYHAFENQAWQPFIDLRYLVLNKGKQGANLGAGLGYQFQHENRLSVYTFFDLTESRTDHIFNQMTAGLAYSHPLVFSGKDWGEIACYLNSYFPLKSHENRVKAPSFGGFKGNHLLICQTDRYALTGSNLELGYLSNSWHSWNLYVAASAYYFKRSELHAFGGLGKLRLTYNDLISIEGQVSGDRLFGTNVNGTIGIRIPLGKKEMKAVKKRYYRPHKSRPIERFEPIVLDKNKRKTVAKDASGNPLNFIFVNNLNGSNGTFEDPFATLLDAQNISRPGDIVYVFPGDGTTKGMDQGFVMKERQTLAGSGVALHVNTSKGPIEIPALTLNGPQIANLAGNGVDINRDCTVSGMTVTSAGSYGFLHTPTDGTSNIRILNCAARDIPLGFGINPSGTANVTLNMANCVANNIGNNGFVVDVSGNASLNLNITNCHTINNIVADAFFIRNAGKSLTGILTNCSARSNIFDVAFYIESDNNANVTLSIIDCLSNNYDSGFSVVCNGSSNTRLTMTRCSTINGASEGFAFETFANSNLILNVDSCLSTDHDEGFIMVLNNNSSSTVNMINSFANNADDEGFYFETRNASNLILNAENCFGNNSDVGFFIHNLGSSLTGNLENCSAIGNTTYSFDINTPNAGTFQIAGDATLSQQL